MLGGCITFKKGQFYIRGVKWNGEWIKLNELPKEAEKERTSLFN